MEIWNYCNSQTFLAVKVVITNNNIRVFGLTADGANNLHKFSQNTASFQVSALKINITTSNHFY